MIMARRTTRKSYDLDNGFRIVATNMGNWTQYEALHLNEDGYLIDGRAFRSCYRREVDAKIAEWRMQQPNS